MKRILCTLCVSLLGWQALAGNVDDSLKKLESVLQKSAKETAKNPAEAGMPSRENFSNMVLPGLRECIASNNMNNAIATLQQVSVSPMLSEDAQKAAAELLAALRAEQEAREKAFAAQTDAALKHAAEAVKTAKTPADLDAVLQELAAAKNRQETRRYSNMEAQTNHNQIEATYRFVARWQDYLAAQATGNVENCRNILRDLANSDTLLMPRSELLARAQAPISPEAEQAKLERPLEEIADELIAKTKSLNDVSGLIKELKRLNTQRRSGNYDRGNLQPYIQSLEQIERNYREFQAGLATNIDMALNSNPTPPAITPFKTQLILLVLPRFISAPADTKPKVGEGATEFLNRVAEEAKAQGNIALALRAREALHQMQRSMTIWAVNDTQGLSKFQAAQNQEAAGQYMLAVISYQEALKSGSDSVPAKLIGERLANLQKKHPEDFEKGMERFLNPPVSSIYPGRMMPGQMGMPGRPESTPALPAPKLAIPPSTPAPAVASPAPEKQPEAAKP